MSLNRDDREFLEDWKIHHNNRNKYLLLRVLFYGIGTAVITSLIVWFGAREEFSMKFTIINVILLSGFWFFYSLWDFKCNEKRYRKIMEKQSS